MLVGLRVVKPTIWVELLVAADTDGVLGLGRLLLALVVRVLLQNLVRSHVQLVEEQLGRGLAHFIFTAEELASLQLKVFFILLLGLNDVPLERLLLNGFANVDFIFLVLLTQFGCGELLLAHLVQIGVQGSAHAWQLAFHGAVPVVFDGVIGTPVKIFRDVGPPVLQFAVLQEQDPLFLVAPTGFLDTRVQVVVPTFTTLLSLAAGQLRSDCCPAHWPMLEHHLEHFFVLLLGPRPLDRLDVVTAC